MRDVSPGRFYLILRCLSLLFGLSLVACSLQTSITDLDEAKKNLIVITVSGNGTADGITPVTITITLKFGGLPITGIIPVYTVTGTGNTLGTCTATNAEGQATCLLRSTTAELKTIAVRFSDVSGTKTVLFVAPNNPRPGFSVTSVGGVLTGGGAYVMRSAGGEPMTPNYLKRPTLVKGLRSGVHAITDP